jgi:hypothetical protein
MVNIFNAHYVAILFVGNAIHQGSYFSQIMEYDAKSVTKEKKNL